MFDKPIRYETPKEPDTSKKFGVGEFLLWMYVVIGLAVGATWPLWVLLMVAL